MTKTKPGRAYECVLIDLNTQRDFCDPGGALPIANLDALIPQLRRLVAWIRWNEAPVVSSLESHRVCEVEGNGHEVFCVDGTPGQAKLEFTALPARVAVEVDNTFSLPLDLFRHWQQVVFRKRTDDLLANPKADRFLTQLPAREYILYGTTVERSIKALALGLLTRERRVTIVVDACGYWHKQTADLALRQVAAKGASLITVAELLQRKLPHRRRYRQRNGWPARTPANGRALGAPGAGLVRGIVPGRPSSRNVAPRNYGV